jgi:hydroxymethylglutaryl-CoA synthase
MYYLDFLAHPESAKFADSALHGLLAGNPGISDPTSTYNDRDLLKICVKESSEAYTERTGPSQQAQKLIGNSYTGSVYTGLDSLLCDKADTLRDGDRVGIFSYGSGLAASLFSARVRTPTSSSNSVQNIARTSNLLQRLQEDREEVTPETFTETLLQRETNGKSLLAPPAAEELASISPGSYFLHEINEQGVRSYERV